MSIVSSVTIKTLKYLLSSHNEKHMNIIILNMMSTWLGLDATNQKLGTYTYYRSTDNLLLDVRNVNNNVCVLEII